MLIKSELYTWMVITDHKICEKKWVDQIQNKVTEEVVENITSEKYQIYNFMSNFDIIKCYWFLF